MKHEHYYAGTKAVLFYPQYCLKYTQSDKRMDKSKHRGETKEKGANKDYLLPPELSKLKAHRSGKIHFFVKNK